MRKKDKILKLKKGEILCPDCKGRAATEVPEYGTLLRYCSKCEGTGKLDWIERVMGKPKNNIHSFFDSSVSSTIAQEIANEIDKEVIQSVIAEAECSNTAMEQIIKEEDKKFDNRIFSELVLHTPIEQKFKGEKD